MDFDALDPNLIEERVRDFGLRLAGTEQFGPLCEGIDDPAVKAATAILMFNQARHYGSLDESTRILQVGNFDKLSFPMIRVVYPNLVANDIVSVQPMLGPTTLVFYMNVQYGTNKGGITAGTNVFDARFGPTGNQTYSQDLITGELLSTQDANDTTPPNGSCNYYPVRPGTVSIVAGAQTLLDDGAGNLTTAAGTGSGSIDYATGAVTSMTFPSTVANGTAVTVSYSYDNEANDLIPEVDISLVSAPVHAKMRKLKARYSLEAAQNLNALHGIDAEAEVVTAMSELHKQEIDREIISDLRAYASAGTVTWDRKVPTGISYTEHKLSLVDAMVACANLIFAKTKRVRPNFMVIGLNVADVVETLPQFQPIAGALDTQDTTGVVKIGTLRGWTVYKDPFFPANEWLMGYKGSGMTRTGFVYAPYIPLFSTPNVILDDFISRRGTATSYGKKVTNAAFYARGSIIQSA